MDKRKGVFRERHKGTLEADVISFGQLPKRQCAQICLIEHFENCGCLGFLFNRASAECFLANSNPNSSYFINSDLPLLEYNANWTT